MLQLTDQLDLHIGVVNGWDVVADNNRAKTIVAKVGINPTPVLLAQQPLPLHLGLWVVPLRKQR